MDTSRFEKEVIILAIVGIFIALLAGLFVIYANTPPRLSSITFQSNTTLNTVSVPPPHSSMTRFTCRTFSSSNSSASIFFNTMEANASVAPAASIEPSGCSYTYTYIDTPVDCGTFCGPTQIADQYFYSYALVLNFSISSISNAEANFTLSSESSLGAMFPIPYTGPSPQMSISVNSIQIPNWHSYVSSNVTTIVVPLPHLPAKTGEYQMTLNASQLLVP